MPYRILLLFAHPRFEDSRTHQALVNAAKEIPDIRIRDLYELYPDFNIDVSVEKDQLLQHDIILWQHPLYWYSCPPLLKQWIDMVLEFGWAYGPGGEALAGKYFLQVVSSGGSREVYSPEGRNRHTIREYLYPFEQTVRLCKATYLPPFLVQGTHKLGEVEIASYAMDYTRFLKYLQHDGPISDLSGFESSNLWLATRNETR